MPFDFKCYRCNHLALENQQFFFRLLLAFGVCKELDNWWRQRLTFVVIVVWSAHTSIVGCGKRNVCVRACTRRKDVANEKGRAKEISNEGKMNIRFISFGRGKTRWKKLRKKLSLSVAIVVFGDSYMSMLLMQPQRERRMLLSSNVRHNIYPATTVDLQFILLFAFGRCCATSSSRCASALVSAICICLMSVCRMHIAHFISFAQFVRL